MIKLIDLFNEIKVNQPLHFPINEDWVYIVKDENEDKKVRSILKSQGWVEISSYLSDAPQFPYYIKGYINKAERKNLLFTYQKPNDNWGKFLNEIKINDPNSSITPQIIYDKLKKSDNIRYEKFINILEDYGFVPEDGEDIKWFLKSLSQDELNELYSKLSKIQEIKINQPGKIQAIYQPDKEAEFDDGKVYKLDLKDRNDIIALGDYSPSFNIIEFYISVNKPKGKDLVDIFKKRKIKYTIVRDQYDNDYVSLVIRDPKKYFEFIDRTNEIKINNPNPSSLIIQQLIRDNSDKINNTPGAVDKYIVICRKYGKTKPVRMMDFLKTLSQDKLNGLYFELKDFFKNLK